MSLREIKFWYFIVRHLPKKLVYFCVMHTWAVASQKYPDKVPDKISWSDAVKALGVE